MLLRIILFTISIACTAAPGHSIAMPPRPIPASYFGSDSTPPLHTINIVDIDSLGSSFETDVLTIRTRNGASYQYEHADWDFEDIHFKLNDKVKEAIDHMQKTFTKVNHPPQFRGGEDSLSNYLKQFCRQHAKELNGMVPAALTLQFIVHLHGEVREVQAIGGDRDPKLRVLAIQAIEEGPDWIPATQNGHLVLSYKMQKIILDL